jgi:glycosyltransferase involved in cell wall biosynthesis
LKDVPSLSDLQTPGLRPHYKPHIDVHKLILRQWPIQIGMLEEAEQAHYDHSTSSFDGLRIEMRIAYVLTSLGVGGAERQVLALAERMKARGHAVSLIVLLPRQPEEWSTTLDAVRLDMRKNPVSLFNGLRKARRFLRDFQPDLIHSHTFPANLAARLLNLRSSTPPLISTIHNVYEGPWPRMMAYRLTDPLSRRTTAVSRAAADRFVRLKAVPARKCSVLTNGIDTAEFVPNPERRERVRAQMGFQNEFVWLAAGRIQPAKDYPNLLRAFSVVRQATPAARLWISGEAESPEAEAVQALAAKLGLGASVRWLGLRRDMPALLDAVDGFVLASAWEGMPLAVGEAMAMEKPVVATNVGGVRELIGECGALVPAKSPESLAKAMLDLMGSTPETRRAFGRAARERIQNHFSMDAKADEWEALYRAELARQGTSD